VLFVLRAQAGGGEGRHRLDHGAGICHAYTPDGRCISLLKILLTNYCLFECAYCINRRSSNVARARFTVEEVVTLTLEFYKRNYIEGLFLSSGIVRSPDHTMEQLMRVARSLRRDHGFAGDIHLKTIPEASPWLIEQAGLWADRLAINLELVSEQSLDKLAPEKDAPAIKTAMGQMHERITEAREERRRFAPAGQSTQVIVGADDTTDEAVLGSSASLYGTFGLRRVYYSAFSPIPEASAVLPAKAPPLQRENRLYQADWLLRLYGFTVEEIAAGGEGGMLDLDADPKLAWALKHRERFPVDVNTADREMLLRVPGVGTRAVLGEGPVGAPIAFVGEQPGDQEDLVGRPFVGPAGQLLDAALGEAGIDRAACYLTNAVKHFEYEQRGKRRLHKSPTSSEIKHYRWWLQKELQLVASRMVVALGASAVLAVAGKAQSVLKARGPAEFGYVTVHPSCLLRLPDAVARQEGYAAFVADLRRIAAMSGASEPPGGRIEQAAQS
jgi:putative DNA modification/repair radical SAM protein